MIHQYFCANGSWFSLAASLAFYSTNQKNNLQDGVTERNSRTKENRKNSVFVSWASFTINYTMNKRMITININDFKPLP